MSSEDKTTIEDKTILENKDDDKTKIENKEQQVYQGPTENLNITTFRKHKIIEELPAKGGESDNYIIEYEGKKAFLKLYRKGIIPKVDLDKIKKLFEEDKYHFVEIYEAGIDDKTQRYYEIMEYIQYGDLKNLINELSSKPIKQKESTIDKIISEIAEALKVLHNNNIIHRDLKSSNVLVRDKDNINLVLIDFGIAKELEQDISKSGTTSFKGTMQYIAPEEISDYFGKEIDWWHLGIIAYELINGSNPFKGLTDNVIVHTLATKGVEIPKDIQQKYQILLKGLLTRDYKKRWGYEEVKRWLSGDTNVNFYYEEVEKSDDEVEKEWQKYNIPPDSNWRKLGLSPSETKAFIDAGFGYNDARRWIQVGWTSGTIARTWYNAGFEPEEALIFEDLGFSIKQASFLKSKGITAFDLEPLRKYKDEKPDLVDEIYSIVQSEDFSKSQDTTNALRKLLREYQNWSKISKNLKDAYDLILLGFSYEEASQCLGNNRSNQNCAEIWHRKGLELQKLKRYNEALKCFDKATQLEPNNANYWNDKGILLKYLNRYEEASQCFDKAIQLEGFMRRFKNVLKDASILNALSILTGLCVLTGLYVLSAYFIIHTTWVYGNPDSYFRSHHEYFALANSVAYFFLFLPFVISIYRYHLDEHNDTFGAFLRAIFDFVSINIVTDLSVFHIKNPTGLFLLTLFYVFVLSLPGILYLWTHLNDT